MQLFHPKSLQNRSIINCATIVPRTKSQSTINRARTPPSSLSNLAKITNVESSINNLAQRRVNKITAPRERSPSPGFRPRRFLTREKKRREERENGKDRAKKRRQSKQKTKRKIRMNTRRIRKCLGDRHNMTFRSSITEEISSSRLFPLEGGALTIRGKKYPRDILSFPLRPFVHILTMHTGLEEDSKLFIVLDCGMKRF